MDGIGFSPAHQMLALCGVDPDEIDDSDSSRERVRRAVDWFGLIRRQDEKLRSASDDVLQYDRTFTYSYSTHDPVMTYFIRRVTDGNFITERRFPGLCRLLPTIRNSSPGCWRCLAQ